MRNEYEIIMNIQLMSKGKMWNYIGELSLKSTSYEYGTKYSIRTWIVQV